MFQFEIDIVQIKIKIEGRQYKKVYFKVTLKIVS